MADDKVWWHVDSSGRCIGYMWPEDMKLIIDSIWGVRKGIAGFAKHNGFSRTAVERWCNGKSAIPLYVANLVHGLEYMCITTHRASKRPTKHLIRADAPWLPDKETEKFTLAKRPFG